MKRGFTIVIERDQDGYFVGTVPQLKGYHTQAKSLYKLMNRIKEAVLLGLEAEGILSEGVLLEQKSGYSWLSRVKKSYLLPGRMS